MKIHASNFFQQIASTWHLMLAGILFILSSIAFQSNAGNQVESTATEVSVIKRALPIYPKYAIKNKIEGAVLVNFSIEKDGNASDIVVAASDHDGLFDASAILGVQKWVYTKSAKKTRNNYVAIEFTLTGKPAETSFSNVEVIQVRGE